MPKLPRGCVSQQDGAPPHSALLTWDFLNQSLPNIWIGRALDEEAVLIHWPPQSGHQTFIHLYLLGFIKTKVYISPMPNNLTQLRQRLKSKIEEIAHAILKRVWDNLERRLVITINEKENILSKLNYKMQSITLNLLTMKNTLFVFFSYMFSDNLKSLHSCRIVHFLAFLSFEVFCLNSHKIKSFCSTCFIF